MNAVLPVPPEEGDVSSPRGDAPLGGAREGTPPHGVSVIIVSYNVRELLDACLQSVRHAATAHGGPVEIIVFDNDSRDGTVALLRPRWPDVVWMPSDRNLGFGTACNRAAATASHELLVFLNPDTLVREDTLAVMRDFFASHPDAGAAGCKVLNRDGSLQAASKRSFPSPRVAAYRFLGLGNLFPQSRVFGRYNLTYLDENQTHEVDAVSGSFLCVRAETFRAVGGFDEDFFMYGEDLDLCFRIKARGYRNYYHPGTQIIHFKGESAKSRPFSTFLHFYEAMILFSKKHLELRALPGFLLSAGVVILAVSNFASSRLRKWPRWLADLAIVNGTLAVATYVYHAALGLTHVALESPRIYFASHALASVAVLLPLAWIGEYGRRLTPLRTVSFASAIGFLVFFSLSYFMRERAYSRIVFAATALSAIPLMVAWRWLANHGGRLFRRIMGGSKRVAILGTGPRAQALAALIQDYALEGYECIGFIHFPPGPIPPDVRPGVVGDLGSLGNLSTKLDLQGVIIALEEDAYPAALQVLARRGARALDIRMLVGDPAPGNITLVELHFGR